MIRCLIQPARRAALCLAAAALPAYGAAAQTFTTLYNFTGADDGAYPGPGFALSGTNLYGTTEFEGAKFGGTAFQWSLASKTMSVVAGFAGPADPGGAPLVAKNVLYTALQYGGPDQLGSLVSVTMPGNAIKTLHAFVFTDGAIPVAAPIEVNGVLYGSTTYGGANNYATLYSYNLKTGVFTDIHDFNGTDGYAPNAPLVNVNGVLYGTSPAGGEFGGGNVFTYTIATSTFAAIYNFTGSGDGIGPLGALVNHNGTLYGFASDYSKAIGQIGGGTIYSINPATGAENTLYTFTGGADGNFPQGAPVFKGDTMYGTTGVGGSFAAGNVFSYNITKKKLTVLHSFGGTDGDLPFSTLVDVKGTLYGTTFEGGTGNFGTIFSLVP